MRKTIKRTSPSPQPAPMNTMGEPDGYVSQEPSWKLASSNYSDTSRMYAAVAGAGAGAGMATGLGSEASSESSDTSRQTRVHELIQQMQSLSVDNDGNNLADFKPLSHPIVNTKKTEGSEGGNGGDGRGGGMGGFDNLPTYVPPVNPRFTPPAPSRPTFSANNLNLDKNSDYRAAYQPPSQIPKYTGGMGGMGGPLPKNDDRLMDKINYMIHLLEEQANEKTNNVLEEFVMFSLVGVFLIYVLDSFSRSGRYVR